MDTLEQPQPLASGWIARQQAKLTDGLRRWWDSVIAQPKLRVGLIGPGLAGKTTAWKELLYVGHVAKNPPAFGLNISRVPQDDIPFRWRPARTIVPTVRHSGKAVITGLWGGEVEFTNVDTQGQKFEELKQPPDILHELRTCRLLVLFIAPDTLRDPDRHKSFQEYANYVEAVRKTSPWVAVAVAFSRADEYGVRLDESDLRILDPNKAVATLLEAFPVAGESNEKSMAWNIITNQVATNGSSPNVIELRRWLMTQSKGLWELLLQVGCAPLLSGYLVSAWPAAPDGTPERHSRRGILQVMADFTNAYRQQLGPAKWRWRLAAASVVAAVVALLYGALPWYRLQQYRTHAPPDASAAVVANNLKAHGLDETPSLPPWYSDLPAHELLVRRFDEAYVALSEQLAANRPAATDTTEVTDRKLKTIADQTKNEPDLFADAALITKREAAVLGEGGVPVFRQLHTALIEDRSAVVDLALALQKALACKPGELREAFKPLAARIGKSHAQLVQRTVKRPGGRTKMTDAILAVWAEPAFDHLIKRNGYEYLAALRLMTDEEVKGIVALGSVERANPYDADLIARCRTDEAAFRVAAIAQKEFPLVKPPAGVTEQVHLVIRQRGTSSPGPAILLLIPDMTLWTESGDEKIASNGVLELKYKEVAPTPPTAIQLIPWELELVGLRHSKFGAKETRYRVSCRGRDGVWLPAGRAGLIASPSDTAITLFDESTKRPVLAGTLPAVITTALEKFAIDNPFPVAPK